MFLFDKGIMYESFQSNLIISSTALFSHWNFYVFICIQLDISILFFKIKFRESNHLTKPKI